MDPRLVVRAQDGDAGAFEALALEAHPRLQRIAVGILRDPDLAEDAVQQALLAIWRDLRRLRDPRSFDGWSYRLLVRRCYAEAKHRPRWDPECELGEQEAPVAGDVYRVVVVRDQLERAFDRLPVDHRAVVVLHHLLDLPVEHIADILEIPVGTVKSRLSRAMCGLRASIEADERLPATASIQELAP
jgi:RNA polymerase sigma-70 factor (ECF subfamily)